LKVVRTDQWELEDIVKRVKQIIEETEFKAEDLILAPDCGLAMMKRDFVMKSLKTMSEAAKILRSEYRK